MDTTVLPPWGYMETFVEDALEKRPRPEAWIPQNPADIQREYTAWLNALTNELSILLWPTYDYEQQAWSRPPSEALIHADFDLMNALRGKLPEPIDGLGDELPSHERLFREEDDADIIFGAHYERYDPGLPRFYAENMTDILWTGCDRKMGSLHYQLKARLQRPRPNQVAYLIGRDFHFLWATTGGTPSMISGHCLQGLMGGCSAFLLFGAIDPVSIRLLQQLTVDVGDRRVFAGVHYPSDNLSSWYTAFRLLPHVVDAAVLPAAKKFLREAIETKSTVYAAIRQHIASNRNSPFKEPLVALAGIM